MLLCVKITRSTDGAMKRRRHDVPGLRAFLAFPTRLASAYPCMVPRYYATGQSFERPPNCQKIGTVHMRRGLGAQRFSVPAMSLLCRPSCGGQLDKLLDNTTPLPFAPGLLRWRHTELHAGFMFLRGYSAQSQSSEWTANLDQPFMCRNAKAN